MSLTIVIIIDTIVSVIIIRTLIRISDILVITSRISIRMMTVIISTTITTIAPMTYMHNYVANLHRMGTGAMLPFSDARSNE